MEKKVYLTNSDEDTRNLSSKLTSQFVGGDVLLLFGPMGSGKTTLTQGIANYFGISRLTSPTYVILNQYDVNQSSSRGGISDVAIQSPPFPLVSGTSRLAGGEFQGGISGLPREYARNDGLNIRPYIKTINHFDLYRLESEDQLKSVNFEEVINDPESLSIVEWPEKLSKLPKTYYQIVIEPMSETQRQITFQKI